MALQHVEINARWVKGIFILPLGIFGVMHFIVPGFFEALVPDFAPYPRLWVLFSGVALAASSLAIFTGILARLANILLIIFVLTFILAVDIPNIFQARIYDSKYFLISLMKDTSLLGGTLLYLIIDLKTNPKTK